MSPYIKQAVEACALPIKVVVESDGWFVVRDRSAGIGYHDHHWSKAEANYVAARNRLLSERKE